MIGLEHVDFPYTQITDAGLTHLKDLTGLQELGLTGTRITDEGLADLKDLTGLASHIVSHRDHGCGPGRLRV